MRSIFMTPSQKRKETAKIQISVCDVRETIDVIVLL